MTTLGMALDVHPGDHYALAGPVRISNADGAWTGTETGAYDPTMGWQFVGWLDGMAAYEGLTLFVHGASPELGDGIWELDGVIFPERRAARAVARIEPRRGHRRSPTLERCGSRVASYAVSGRRRGAVHTWPPGPR